MSLVGDQIRASKISLVLDDTPVLHKCRVLDHPFWHQISVQPSVTLGRVRKDAGALESLAEKLPQRALRQDVCAVCVDEKLDSLSLGELDERRRHAAAVSDVDLVHCRSHVHPLEEVGQLLCSKLRDAERPDDAPLLKFLQNGPCCHLRLDIALRRVALVGFVLAVALEGHSRETGNEEVDMLNTEFSPNEGQCLLDVAGSIGDGRRGQEEELGGDIVVGGFFSEAGQGPVDAGDVASVVLLGRPDVKPRPGVRLAIQPVAIESRMAVAIGFGGIFVRIILLRGEKVASEGVGEFEVGSVGPRFADDGWAARDNVPGEKRKPISTCSHEQPAQRVAIYETQTLRL